MKPNCYECQYRDSVPGSAHSSCNHPSIESDKKDPVGILFAILASAGRVPSSMMGDDKLGIKAKPQGIRGGWFNFPWDFDPIWLEKCKGFTSKKKD